MSNPFDNPDYLKLLQTKKALEDYGKSEVLKYEKYRVSMFSQSLAEKVQENKDPQAEYNIDSFDEQARPLSIDVKTTADLNGTNPFELSIQEYRSMVRKKEQYQIYRVYAIHSTKPSFYKLKYPLDDVVDRYQKDILCALKPRG